MTFKRGDLVKTKTHLSDITVVTKINGTEYDAKAKRFINIKKETIGEIQGWGSCGEDAGCYLVWFPLLSVYMLHCDGGWITKL